MRGFTPPLTARATLTFNIALWPMGFSSRSRKTFPRPSTSFGYRKQRHTAKRIFERLRDEHGFTGGYTIVKDYVREHRRHRREMFVPLTHPPGHAQADFGEAWAVIAGVKQKVHFFVFDLPQSDASYVRAYRAATAEAWVDGHVHAFSFFGAVALSIVYDNDRCLVSRIERDGTRRRGHPLRPLCRRQSDAHDRVDARRHARRTRARVPGTLHPLHAVPRRTCRRRGDG